jgi:hypothetical protein
MRGRGKKEYRAMPTSYADGRTSLLSDRVRRTARALSLSPLDSGRRPSNRNMRSRVSGLGSASFVPRGRPSTSRSESWFGVPSVNPGVRSPRGVCWGEGVSAASSATGRIGAPSRGGTMILSGCRS